LTGLGLVKKIELLVAHCPRGLVLLVAVPLWCGLRCMPCTRFWRMFGSVQGPDTGLLDSWLPDYAAGQGHDEFTERGYALMVATGGLCLWEFLLIEYRTEGGGQGGHFETAGF